MAWWRRCDGELVRDLPNLRRVMPYVMRSRNESAVYFEQRVDVGRAERFVRAFNEAHPETRATVFHVLMWACRNGLAEFPGLNRFVAGGRHYDRDGIWISYSAKQRMQKGAPLIVLKREFDPGEPFPTMVRAMQDQLHAAKFSGDANTVDGELKALLMLPGSLRRVALGLHRVLEANGLFPRPFVENDPLYATLFLSDLGSLGMDAAYHHLYEYGTIGVFGVMGRVRAEQVPDPDTGALVRKRLLTVRYSFDERVEDGLYAGYGLKHVTKLIEDPLKGGITTGDDATVAVLERTAEGRAEQA